MTFTKADHIENLKEGDWIVVIGLIDDPPPEQPERNPWEEFPVWPYASARRKPTSWTPVGNPDRSITFAPNGIPYYILAIDVPFVGVTDGCSLKASIDIRRVQIRKVSDRYAEMMNRFTSDFGWTDDGRVIPVPDKEEFSTSKDSSPSEDSPTCYCYYCGTKTEPQQAPSFAPGSIAYVCPNQSCRGYGQAIGFSP